MGCPGEFSVPEKGKAPLREGMGFRFVPGRRSAAARSARRPTATAGCHTLSCQDTDSERGPVTERERGLGIMGTEAVNRRC